MKREELLSATRKHLWAAWALSGEEIGSTAAEALLGLGMLVEPGGAAELVRLRRKVAELEEHRAALIAQNELLQQSASKAPKPWVSREEQYKSPLHQEHHIPHDLDLPDLGGAR